MYECVWLKLCQTMLFLVLMLQALSFWMAATPQSLGLLAEIEGIKIVIVDSETCLIWGHYRFGIGARFDLPRWNMEYGKCSYESQKVG